ncbi:hypothetical protein EGM_16427 [Macaca fascicularis]|uniref:T cell receptor alpha variable 39 n=1 Tax=Macaca fascicularis TaxID=9541 RepID=G7P9T5_MACFA|nr:hypothetical protein EGM_16427 [Macaca fascicularis]
MKKLLAVILWLQLDWLSGELKVGQNPLFLSTQEGKNYTIYCNYSTASDRLYWYRQDPGKSLESLFVLLSNGAVKQEGRLMASLDTKARLSSLHITAALQDLSATYFCAVDTQCSPDAASLYPNLQLVGPLLLQEL